ncbi:MAG: PVC-type heme-binding CxxCH protein [Gemmataceae bacterium]
MSRLLLVAAFAAVGAVPGGGVQPRPSPETHQVALNGHNFTLPEGFTVELIAGPGVVRFPVAAAFDDVGHLYVTEASGTNDNVKKQLAELPHRLLKLTDADRDGRFEKSEVFADGFMLPQGVMWKDGAVYVGAPPTITKLTPGSDGKLAKRETWFDGKTLTGCANDLHGPYAGPDGWIYWTKGAFAEQRYTVNGKPFVTKAAHVFRARPDGTGVEPVMTGGMDNPVDVAFTPTGDRLFTTTFFQHPGKGRRDGLIHAVYGGVWGKDHAPVYAHPWTGPDLMPVMTHLGAAAPCGLHRYEHTQFGHAYEDNLFACCFNQRRVTRHVLVPNGATYKTLDSDFLTSDNLDFHPTDVIEDRDGSLLVVDTGGWYKLCCPTSQLVKPDIGGAIYRLRKVNPSPAPTKPDPIRQRREAVWAASRQELQATGTGLPTARQALTDPDESVRHVAAHVVGLYRDKAAVPALTKLASSDPPHVRRVAAEALGRIGDPAAAPVLLTAHAGVTDRALQHALTFALIEIGDPKATAVGLSSPDSLIQRAAITALDQMRDGGLKPEPVLAALDSPSSELKATAWWVLGKHPGWASALAPGLRDRLAKPVTNLEHDELVNRLAKLSANPAVQQVIADAARNTGKPTPQNNQVALQAMARSGLKEIPPAWQDALIEALRHGNTPIAVAAIKAFPAGRSFPSRLADELRRVGESDIATGVAMAALTAIPGGLPEVNDKLFDFLIGRFDAAEDRPTYIPEAVEILSRAKLTPAQLRTLAERQPRAGPIHLPKLLNAFTRSADPEVGRALVAALSDPKVRPGVRAEVVRPILDKYPEAVRGEAAKLYAALDADRGGEREKLTAILADLPTGDIRRGQVVFNGPKAACITCHQMGYVGGKVGPDLTRIGGIRSDRDLLEAIVFPNASFVRSYEPVAVTTADGRTVSGVLRDDRPDEVVLAVSATEEVRIPRRDIEEVKPGTVSVMPSGFDQQLSKQELADLVAFLKASK